MKLRRRPTDTRRAVARVLSLVGARTPENPMGRQPSLAPNLKLPPYLASIRIRSQAKPHLGLLGERLGRELGVGVRLEALSN